MPTNSSTGRSRLLAALCAAGVLVLWALHWPHLIADFPNFSPWEDYAKYTDEGWYGSAAIWATLFGRWRMPGAFNPAVALPVWPTLEWLLFQFTGVTVGAARGLALCVFGGNLLLSYAVLRAAGARHITAYGAVLLLSGSMYFWAFSRLAILEPLLSFWILGGWLLALRLRLLQGASRTLALLGLGFLSCLAVLTKTTAVFLLPGTALLLGWATGWQRKRVVHDISITFLGGTLPWLAYYLLFARRYALDFHYLFTVNYTVTPKGLHDHLLAYWYAAHGLLWVGPWLVCTVLALLAAAGALSSNFRRSPLIHASLLSAVGYILFIGWHNNPQPRYYMVLAYPVVFVAVLGVQSLFLLPKAGRILAGAAVAMLAVIFVRDVKNSIWYVRHPQYTLLNAATGLTAYIDAHPDGAKRLLLSISGDEITLFTHLPAICDDFGTGGLDERILRYRPGWYAQWNELDPGTLEDIHDAGYSLRAVAHWHAFDDEDRDDLILYRMVRTEPADTEQNSPAAIK